MLRRSAAALTALALAVPALVLAPSAVSAADEVAPSADLGAVLAHYDFAGLPGAPVAGDVVADASGRGNDAVVREAGATAADGALALPGGASSSGAAYVELPAGLVDGQSTLTVSAWLRNETAAGNHAALFLGTRESTPHQYWLLNLKNPAGRLKSVVTGSLSPTAPWGTEVGVSPTNAAQGVPGPATGDGWMLVTTVLQPGSITTYLDGALVASVPVARTVADLGTDLVGYVGRSSYADPYWKGQVRALTLSTAAPTAEEVARDYLEGVGDEATVLAALEADAAAVDLGPSPVTADLRLPATGPRGSTITWQSSDPRYVAADGTVTRPADADVDVVLTATVAAAGLSVERAVTVTVAADSPDRNLELVADRFDLGTTHLAGDVVLRTVVDGTTVSWASSAPAVVDPDGTVTRGAAPQQVTLTATFALDGRTTERSYEVTVLAADVGRVGAYTVTGGTTRTDVLHLATVDAAGATEYTPVLSGRGVLYPTLGSARFGSPSLFRTPDGTFGLLATQATGSAQVFVYDSVDLVTYTGERLVTLPVVPARVSVVHDNGIGAYRVTIVGTDGVTYETHSTDLVTFTTPVAAETEPPGVEAPGVGSSSDASFPAEAVQTTSVAVTASELDRVTSKLGRVVATGVVPFDDVAVEVGTEVTPTTTSLPSAATITYSSGYDAQAPVVWDAQDVAAVDTSVPGTYTVRGTVTPTVYADPLVERRADPDVTLGDDGWYYFTASYPMTRPDDPTGYDRVVLRRAQTIAGLADAPEVTIWHEAQDPTLNRYVWAPELEKIGDRWYVLFTAARGGGVWDIRPVMLEFTGDTFAGEATLDPASWRSLGQVRAVPGDTEAFTHFSLDMTHLETGGKHYVVWAEKPGASDLRIAEIDPADPSRLTTRSVLLSTPTFAWESNDGQSINEGPAVIEHDGTIVLTYSAATVDDKYSVGMLSMPVGADPMDPASWTKNPYPLLTTADVPGQVGPGHNSFTVDELGNPVIVYHSRTVDDVSAPGESTDAGLFDPRRHARAATVHWDVDGLPVFAMTSEEQLPSELRQVETRVVVTDEAVDPGPVDPPVGPGPGEPPVDPGPGVPPVTPGPGVPAPVDPVPGEPGPVGAGSVGPAPATPPASPDGPSSSPLAGTTTGESPDLASTGTTAGAAALAAAVALVLGAASIALHRRLGRRRAGG